MSDHDRWADDGGMDGYDDEGGYVSEDEGGAMSHAEVERVEELLKSLLASVSDEAAVARIIQELVLKVSHVRAVNQEALGTALVACICGFPGNTAVASGGVRLVRVAVRLGDDLERDALVAGGIITALVIAMRHHTTSEPLAMHATDALTVLASDPTHRQAVVMAGGAEAVTACMAAHADSAEMQAAGCALLQVISFDETVKPDLVEAGCVTAASEALSRHADVPAVVMNAVSFLYFVADEVSTQVHSGGSRGDVLAEGVVTSLLRAMRKCEHEPDVQAQGISLLHSMCVDSPRRVLATKLGAAGVALGALQTVMDSPEVQSDALSVLKALTGDEQCRPYIGSVEGTENIGKMMDVIAELRGNVGSKRHGQVVLDLAVPTLIQLNHIYEAQVQLESQTAYTMPRPRGRQGATVTWEESRVNTSSSSSVDTRMRRSQSQGGLLRASGGRTFAGTDVNGTYVAPSAGGHDAAVKALQGEVAALTEQLAAMRDVHAKSAEEAARLQVQLEASRTQEAASKASQGQLRASVQALQAEIAALQQSQAVDAETEHSVTDSLRTSLREARSAAAAAKEACRDTELQRDTVAAELDTCRAAVEAERRRTDALRQAMSKAERVAASVTADMQESCDTARQSAADARAKLAAAQDRCRVLEQERDSAQQAAAEEQGRAAALESQLTEAQHAARDALAQARNLRAALPSPTSASRAKAAAARADALEAQLASTQKELEQCRASEQAMRDKYDPLKLRLRKHAAIIKRERAAAKTTNETLDNVQQLLRETQDELAETRARVKQLEGEVERSHKALASAKQQRLPPRPPPARRTVYTRAQWTQTAEDASDGAVTVARVRQLERAVELSMARVDAGNVALERQDVELRRAQAATSMAAEEVAAYRQKADVAVQAVVALRQRTASLIQAERARAKSAIAAAYAKARLAAKAATDAASAAQHAASAAHHVGDGSPHAGANMSRGDASFTSTSWSMERAASATRATASASFVGDERIELTPLRSSGTSTGHQPPTPRSNPSAARVHSPRGAAESSVSPAAPRSLRGQNQPHDSASEGDDDGGDDGSGVRGTGGSTGNGSGATGAVAPRSALRTRHSAARPLPVGLPSLVAVPREVAAVLDRERHALRDIFMNYAERSRVSPDDPLRITHTYILEFAAEFLVSPVHVSKVVVVELFTDATAPDEVVEAQWRAAGGAEGTGCELVRGQMGFQQFLWFLARLSSKLRTHHRDVDHVVQLLSLLQLLDASGAKTSITNNRQTGHIIREFNLSAPSAEALRRAAGVQKLLREREERGRQLLSRRARATPTTGAAAGATVEQARPGLEHEQHDAPGSPAAHNNGGSGRDGSAGSATAPAGSAPDPVTWLECARCHKFRAVPSISALVQAKRAKQQAGGEWTCQMNSWDRSQASCDAASSRAAQVAV